jgi:hypothetical protein
MGYCVQSDVVKKKLKPIKKFLKDNMHEVEILDI